LIEVVLVSLVNIAAKSKTRSNLYKWNCVTLDIIGLQSEPVEAEEEAVVDWRYFLPL
jgi:hypothetical protein